MVPTEPGLTRLIEQDSHCKQCPSDQPHTNLVPLFSPTSYRYSEIADH